MVILGRLLNCGTDRITENARQKKQFEPRDGFDLDELARRLQPLVEPFIQSRGRASVRTRARRREALPRARE